MAACAITLPIGLAVVVPSVGASSRPAQTSVNAEAAAVGDGQFVAVAASDADYAGLKADVEAAGGRVVRELPVVGTLVVKAPKAAKARMAASVHAAGVASDHIESIVPPEMAAAGASACRVQRVDVANNGPSVTPDPASSMPGLLWNQQRVNMTDAGKVTAGEPAVTVGVADTGLDSPIPSWDPSHRVQDFTITEDPICKTFVARPITRRTPTWQPVWRSSQHRLARPRRGLAATSAPRSMARHQRHRPAATRGTQELTVVRLGV